jgi:hypothetical protein
MSKLMSQTESPGAGGAPWHLWLIGGATLLWNVRTGYYDYLLPQIHSPEYLHSVGEQFAAFVLQVPLWYWIAYACGVIACIAGSVLLLCRSRLSLYAFGIALIIVPISVSYFLFFSDGAYMMRSAAAWAPPALRVGEFAYVLWLRRNHVLR